VTDAFNDAVVQYTIAASPYNGGGTGTVTREAVLMIEGTACLKLTCPEGKTLRADRTFGADQDWSQFTGGASSDSDFFTFRVKCNNADYLDGIQVIIDINSAAAGKDFFYTPGKIVPGIKYESKTERRYYGRGMAMEKKPVVQEVVTQESISLEYLPATTSEWAVFTVPKGDLTRQGTTEAKGWNTVKKMSFVVWASKDTGGSDLIVYIDDGKIIGAAGGETGLNGDYYFCAGYYNSTRNEYYEVSEETDAVTFITQNAYVANVPATFNAQADKYIVWCRAADDSFWYQLGQFNAAAAATSVNISAESLLDQPELSEQAGIYPMPKQLSSGQTVTRDATNNSVPPVGDFIVFHQGKLFVLHDDKIYHSKPGQPWAVPVDFYLQQATTSDPFTAAYSDGSSLIVHTKARDFIYISPGEYDNGYLYMGHLDSGKRVRGCIAPHSVHSGIYASAQGLANFDGTNSTLLTKGKVHPTFRAISSKSTLHGVVYEDLYLLVNPGGNSLVMELVGNVFRFYQWAFTSTARCCCIDAQVNRLYIGTDTGIYYYNPDVNSDSGGSFTFSATSRKFEYAEENKDAPVERFMVDCNTGGNTLTASILIDGVSHGTESITNLAKTEEEGFMDLGALGSFAQVVLTGTVSQDAPIRVYAIEVS
jgi:hypothetical protein